MKTKFLKAAVLLATVRLTFVFAKNITERIVYDGIPRELVRLKNRNPETADFVDGFRENAARNFEIDLSDRARLAGEGEVPLLLQWDERWGYRKYRGEYRAISACGPTVMSMAAIWVFEDEKYDPRYMMDFAREGGWRSPGSGTLHSFISRGGKELGLDVKEINPDEERVKSAFSRGGDVCIIRLMGPGPFTKTGHFILLIGMTEEGRITLNDPNSKKKSRKSWEVSEVTDSMRKAWTVKKPAR